METTEVTQFGVGMRPAHRWIRKTDQIPRLGATEGTPNPTVKVKLFCPWSMWTWYVVEANLETGDAYGYVVGHEREIGYFSLKEMASIKGRFGLTIERDLHWTPTGLKDVMNGEAV